MKKLAAAIAVAALIAGAVFLYLQHQAQEKLRAPLADATKKHRQSPNISMADREKYSAEFKMNNAKQFVLAMTMFADDNRNQFPTNLNQMMSYFGDANWARKNLEQFEIIYQGSLTNIAKPSDAIVVREKQPWPYLGKLAKVYGFADGHVEIKTMESQTLGLASQEYFDAYEKQHIIPPLSNQ